MIKNKELFYFLLAASSLVQTFSQAQESLEIKEIKTSTIQALGPQGQFTDEKTPSSLQEAVFPTYISLRHSINEFPAFADGGWDGNWYVGYNNCWIVQLPSAPQKKYMRAYIGAKLGRAKTQPRPGHELERMTIPGKIYMALSSSPGFSADQSYLLALTKEIGTEPDPSLINQDTRKSAWFWVEVPVNLINFNGPNYLALYSPTEYLQSVSSSPILGAAMTNSPSPHAWLNRSIHGTAPSDPATALETPLNYLAPAMAIKLVPQGGSALVVGNLEAVQEKDGIQISFSGLGENIEAAWVEISLDNLDWEKRGPMLHQPPYIFVLPAQNLPHGDLYVRGVIRDILGDTAASPGTPLHSVP